MSDEGPPGYPVPIRLGDRLVGWAAADLTGAVPGDAPRPLLLVPATFDALAVRTGRRGFVVVKHRVKRAPLVSREMPPAQMFS